MKKQPDGSAAAQRIALLAVVLLAASAVTAFAAGKTDEDAFETVEGTGNWEHTIDVSELEPGKYNILVRARDRAGNEALGGPFNVQVDPASDQPLASISYPTPNQAVGERMYIIGTAIDDDAVGRIEIRVDDRSPITAEGTDFWSAFVSLASLEDGPHTITATVFDINGTASEPVSVNVNLDTTAPATFTESHDSGVLISRKTDISGAVEDANGVTGLSLITGEGEQPLRLQGREELRKEFAFEIDPRELEEGATVWWLRSVDGTGTVAYVPFLFFVDTSPPELEIITPLEDEPVDGRLSFVGRASDAVRLASLTYELNTGETGEIELIPGNPYWSLDVDLGTDLGRSLTAEFRVEDTAGNTTERRLRYSVDAEADRPVLRLSSPTDGTTIEHVTMVGHVLDDDAAAAIRYTLDGSEPTEVETDGAFVVDLPDLGPGNHDLRVTPVDINGTTGEEVRVRFAVATPLPVITLESVTVGETATDYEPGFTLAAGDRAVLSGSLEGEAPVGRVQFRVGSKLGRSNVDESGGFTIALPRSSVAAAVPIDVWFTNEIGLISRTVGFYVQLPEAPEPTVDEEGNETPGPAPVITDVLSPGLYVGPDVAPGALNGVEVPPEAAAALTAPILVQADSPLLVRAIGGAPSEPSLDDAAYSVVAQGNVLAVSPAAGATESTYVETLRISATVDGASRQADPIAVTAELEAPTIERDPAWIGAWAAGDPPVTVTASDPAGLESVRARLIRPADPAAEGAEQSAEPRWVDGESSTDGETSTADAYSIPVRLEGDDGPIIAEIEARDATGRVRTILIPFFADRTAPGLTLLTPPEGTSVNGTVSVIAQLTEPNTTAELVSIVGGERSQLPVQETVTVTLAATEEQNQVTFELVDRAGNQATQQINLTVDQAGDRPTLQLQVPEENGVVREEFRISGVLLDDDEPAMLRYSVDGGEPREVPTTGVFDISASMDDLEDGTHTLEVVGLDLGGTESAPVQRSFSVSRTEPVSSVERPTIDDYLSGTILVTGVSEDPNGIAEVQISTDNGASFQRARAVRRPEAEGNEEIVDETSFPWEYRLDSKRIEDGTHSILVRATDNADTEGLFTTTINIDNTAPLLELTSPGDGDSVSGEFIIDGRSDDPALSEVRLVAQPLSYDEDGTTAMAIGTEMVLATFDQPGPFAYVVDSSSLPTGWFNLRVEAEDYAGNTSRISRNIHVEPPALLSNPRILTPTDGADVAHRFRIDVQSPIPKASLTVLLDGRPFEVVQTDEAGNGTLVVEPDAIDEGEHELQLRAEPGGSEEPLLSTVTRISYTELGPWLVIDTPENGSYIRNRPFLSGTAGYALELTEGGDDERAVRDANKRILSAHELQRVEVSLDNGRNYRVASGTEQWQFRIETTEMPDGPVYMVVRAVFADGTSAVTRHTVYIDETPPQVRLLQPQERDRFDESVTVVGVTTDDTMLSDVAVVLREGDKSRYEVPSFVQGLYIDVHGLGATYFDVGAGLTFFDDNVRLQAQLGVSPPGRFSGLVMGVKLLANVFSFPASYFFGPDLSWLSAAIAVGANFSYYTMSDDTIGFTDEGLVLAGMVAQIEFPRVEIPTMPVFNTFGFYTEGQLWFISSDVEAGAAFRLGFGLRTNVF